MSISTIAPGQPSKSTELAEARSAHAANPSAQTLERVANAHWQLGEFPEAYLAYEALVSMPESASNTKARERLTELSWRTGLLSINVDLPGADVRVDGVLIGKGPLRIT